MCDGVMDLINAGVVNNSKKRLIKALQQQHSSWEQEKCMIL